MLDSLVRVSRRVEENHLVSIANQEVPHAKREACSSKYAALNPNLGPTKHIHPPTGKRPCPWSLRQAWTDADTPSKKHSKSHAQNQQPHLRCDRKPSHWHEAVLPRWLVPFASLSAISGTFNSLFKVLFTFPSWYLFAIGLKPLFSFRWNLPPTLRSNSEERDSEKAYRTQRAAGDTQDSHPQWCSFPRGLHLRLCWRYFLRLQFKARGPNFHAELVPVHSPLLRESYLVSFPPLTYMLKFSGFADLTSCQRWQSQWLHKVLCQQWQPQPLRQKQTPFQTAKVVATL